MPSLSRMTRSQSRSTSSIWWVTMTTVAPPCFCSAMMSISRRRLTGSKPLVGSSRISSSGLFMMVTPSWTFCCCPLESLSSTVEARSAERHPVQVLERPLFGGAPLHPLEPAEVGHDVDDLFLLVQPALLGKVAQPVAVLGLEVPAVDVEDSGGGLVDAQQGPDGGGLAGAVAAEETEGLAGVHVEGQVADHGGVAEVHSEAADVDPCFVHCGSRLRRAACPECCRFAA